MLSPPVASILRPAGAIKFKCRKSSCSFSRTEHPKPLACVGLASRRSLISRRHQSSRGRSSPQRGAKSQRHQIGSISTSMKLAGWCSLRTTISNVDIAAGAVAAIAPTLLAKISADFELMVGAPPNAPWRPSTPSRLIRPLSSLATKGVNKPGLAGLDYKRNIFFALPYKILRSISLLDARRRMAAMVCAPWQPGPRPMTSLQSLP